MSMLAGPRRKQKVINLRAKNNAWSNDTNKFGQRMLEKMGWSSGKGLGAKENGIVEHVIAKYKNDDKGLGFEDKNDQWTKHEDDFNALLANLSNGDGNEEKLHSGVSLEVKSKKSKARVHFHKFTRAKDLTRYSEKDLANIFGKKSLKEEESNEEPLQEDITSTEQVFTEKGSMVDYFKNKIANFRSKSKLVYSDNEPSDNAEYAFKGFSTNTDDDSQNDTQTVGFGFSFYNNSTNDNDIHSDNGNTNVGGTDCVEETKKIKKKKKNKNNENNVDKDYNGATEIYVEENVTTKSEDPEAESNKSKKKSKKKKKKICEEPIPDEQPEEPKPKKKKSKNNKNDVINPIEEPQAPQVCEQDTDYVPKKKKKRKNKDE